MMMIQHLILMRDIPLDMILTKVSWPSNQDKKAIPVTIQNQHQPLFWTVSALSTVPAISSLLFLQYPNPKSKGTSYCSRNSYYSQQSWEITVAVGGNSIHPSKSRISPWFQQHPMLLSAYLKEPTPQSSSGSKLLPQQHKSFREALFTAEISSLSQALGIVS